MRAPSSTLVLDAAILVSAVFGRSSAAILRAANTMALVTTERVVQEAQRRVELGSKRPNLLPILDALLEEVTIVSLETLAALLHESETLLRDAAANRNGSIKDAHVLALALNTGADIWTTDRNFAGTGVATWSTPNLMRGLAENAS